MTQEASPIGRGTPIIAPNPTLTSESLMGLAGMSRICDNYMANGFGTPDGVRRLAEGDHLVQQRTRRRAVPIHERANKALLDLPHRTGFVCLTSKGSRGRWPRADARR
jgi:hypothetical protein